MNREFWLLIHLLGVVIWVGGIFFAHMVLRPSVQELTPAERLPLMRAVIGRFLHWALIAIALILASGVFLWGSTPMARAPVGWHLMLGGFGLMLAVYLYLRFVPFGRLETALDQGDLGAAGTQLAMIRLLMGINLLFGLGVMAAALLLG
ncbi:MAG TPA: CopD family protein [Burkholderiaceae bacterium]|nr:CopD family protein [Burkholderiaceae bacterium]